MNEYMKIAKAQRGAKIARIRRWIAKMGYQDLAPRIPIPPTYGPLSPQPDELEIMGELAAIFFEASTSNTT